MSNYNLSELVLKSHYGGNSLISDDAGLPSVMVYIPAFKNSDVLNGGDDSTHPAFIVNGKEIPGFYYSKYENVVIDGKAYSLPGEKPTVWTSLATITKYCEAKGHGWHLSTAAEWAAIALWCKKNGFLPYGANSWGKDSRESDYKAIAANQDGEGNINLVATGTGPLTWSHDGTASGIWDMNGNVWEWQAGLRLVWGELQLLANNDAADPDNPQNATSTCWKAINAADGTLVEPECFVSDTAVKTSGSTVKLDYVGNVWIYSTGVSNAENMSRSCEFVSATCTDAIGEATKVLLRSLALLPDVGATAEIYEGDRMNWNNNYAERLIYRGGCYNNVKDAGVFSLNGTDRPTTGAYLGFRSAYIPELE